VAALVSRVKTGFNGGAIHQSAILARPTSSVFASGQRLQVQTIGPGDSWDEIGDGFAGGV
jgi:hypothetical protein